MIRFASSLVPVRRTLALVALLAAGAPRGVSAQIGHAPDRSPYEDLKGGQNISLSAGWLAVKRDPANVAPKAGPFGMVRYDITIGGPAAFFARYVFAPSERNLLVPANPRPTRVIATPSVTTHVADVGLDIALTGRKTWRRLVPSISGGIGLASDFAKADTGAYRFGTRFAFMYGGALRYIPRNGRVSYRVDVTNYLWQYQYPDRYFVRASDSTAVVSDTRQRSVYRGNWALSGGVTIPIFR